MPWTASFDQLTHDFSTLPFVYQELTQVVKITPAVSGKNCRLHLTNRYGRQALTFDSVSISQANHGGQRFFRFHGSTAMTIPTGGEIDTDPLSFQLNIEQPVFITMRSQHRQAYADFASTYHPGWVNAILSRSAQANPDFSNNWKQRKGWFCLEHLDVLTPRPLLDVEVTGDSLVETGMLTTPLLHYACRRFPNQISWHMTGILGNQLLQDGPADQPLYQTFGPSLLKRQVLQEPRPLTIACIGSNDLLVPLYSQLEAMPTVEQLINGYTQLAQHCRSLIVPSLTPVTPPGLSTNDLGQIQKLRQSINDWLKLQPYCVDINPSMADAGDCQLKDGMGFGDGLHWSPRGGRQAAQLLFPPISSQISRLQL